VQELVQETTQEIPETPETVETPKDKLRVYRIDGHDYPSVTSIISYVFGMPPEMMTWVARNSALRALREQRAAKKAGKKITQKQLVELALTERHRLLKESQLKGTTVHTLIEKFYTNGEEPQTIEKKYQGYWNSFKRFKEFFHVVPILQETVVYSHKYKFAGRMDFYGTLQRQGQKKRVLIDFKTSNFLKSEYGLQLAAYKHCLETMGYPVDETYILHLRSHGFYEFVKFDEPLERFVWARKLFSWKANLEKPEFELAWTPEEAISKLKTA